MKKVLFLVVLLQAFTLCHAQQIDSEALNNVFGKKGMVSGNVYKISYPRTDLKVEINGFKVAPGLALGSWAGIIQMHDGAMMMGDLVLLDTEVPKAVKKLVEEGLQVTAIHNHLINEKPAIKYVHFHGTGDAITLAKEIKAVWEVTGTPLTGQTKAQPENKKFDWSKVTAILGSGKENGNLLQYAFPRKEKLTESGMEMPPSIGMATSINLQMDGNRAAITGDFVLLADEVNPVVKALTENGITVTAIHNHMLNDEPRLFMMHFWAVGEPETLAKGLKAALDKTNSKM